MSIPRARLGAISRSVYQSIDQEPEVEEPRGGLRAALPWAVGALAILGVFAAVFAFSPGPPAQSGDPLQPEPEARAAYLRAIAESDPALRRARLRDFLNQNPQDPRSAAAQAQLYVLDQAEATAWQDTVSAAYAPGATPEERRAAVEAFQAKWGRYLGGRDEDASALLAQIDGLEATEPKPDRSLPEQPSPFPKNVPADRLAGGPVIARPPPPVIARPQPTAPRPTQPARVAEVTPPRVRRNVTPRYPRRAQRRGVDGIVTLALDIDERGRVALAEVISVEAERYADEFARAAERAAMRTRFHPKTVNGEPVESIGVRKRYRFESSQGR